MRVAAIQMNSGDDLDGNLRAADELLTEASRRDVRLAVLPENFAFIGVDDADKIALAEEEGAGPIQDFLADAARRLQLWIVSGSLPLVSPKPDLCFGGCVVFGADGSAYGTYRKIHLFDVDLPDSDESYRESATMDRGRERVVVDTPAGCTGLSICYDLRFPELYRELTCMGATVFTVPAAFTEITGRAHWQPLLRARAIENLAYVIAPGQFGAHPNGRTTWGHSQIVDPWGQVLAEQAEGACVVDAELDPGLPSWLREQFPVLEHRYERQA